MSPPFSEDDLEQVSDRRGYIEQPAPLGWLQHRALGLVLFCFALLAFALLDKGAAGHEASAPVSEVVSYVAMNTTSQSSYSDVVHAVTDLQDDLAALQQRLQSIKEGLNMCGMEECASKDQCCHGKMCCTGGTKCCPAGNCCGEDSICCVSPGGLGHCCGKGSICCKNGLCGDPGSTCKGDIVLAPDVFKVHKSETPGLMAEIRATEDIAKQNPAPPAPPPPAPPAPPPAPPAAHPASPPAPPAPHPAPPAAPPAPPVRRTAPPASPPATPAAPPASPATA